MRWGVQKGGKVLGNYKEFIAIVFFYETYENVLEAFCNELRKTNRSPFSDFFPAWKSILILVLRIYLRQFYEIVRQRAI